ncbi:beta strand repeat-containing protein [Nubsella zeaxanthinifaciens]|uniref:beta strand repeat-containing protein n=1 Tax=Nubsella zeaxanthinifaciens TaxID=392412 RepID=UPI001300803B|nr:hypothetical protein [Nubsella zeaxanthinifaciens]
MKFLKEIFFLLFICVLGFSSSAQIKVIDNKGTLSSIDTSKWTISGVNIFNKNSGNVGIGTSMPQTKLHVDGQLRLQGLGISTTNVDVLTTDANGDVYRRTLSSLLSTTSVSNTVTSPNSLTTTVNGVTGTSVSMVTGVSNSSSTNSLSTTVNGVTGTSVNIINSNALAGASNKLTSTVNGVAADLTPSSGTIASSKLLGFDASGNLVLGADPTATSVSNSSSTNSMSTTVNGVTGTSVNIINSNALAGASNKLTSTVNGVAADLTPSSGTIASSKLLGFDASGNLVLGADPTATSVSNSSSTNSMSTTVNGVTGTSVNIINSNALAGASNKLTSTVNGVAADLTPSSGTIASSKLLGFDSSGNLVLGADPTATSVSNTVTSPNSLTTTVNGVTGTSVSMVTGVSNSSSTNSLSTTVNGVTGTSVNIINSNALAGASNKLTSTVNGVAADLAPSSGTIASSKLLGFDAGGNLVVGADPGVVNSIYTADDALTGNRTVDMPSSRTLAFSPSGTQVVNQFSVDGTTFSIDALNKRIGLGTSSPTEKLQIVGGNQMVQSSSGVGGVITVLNTATTNQFRIDPMDAVGPKLKLGTSSDPIAFWEMGAYNSINNFDNKGRDYKIFNNANTNALFVKGSNGFVGVSTITPATTLDVQGKPGSATVADGVTFPRLTGDQLKAKDATYTDAGTIVYVTAAVGTASTKTANVNAIGLYQFNGTIWQRLATTNVATKKMVIPAEYAGAVLTPSGTANVGDMIADNTRTTVTPNWMNYYEWTGRDASTAQTYQVAVRVTLPNDFVSWDSSNAVQIDNLANTGCSASFEWFLSGTTAFASQTNITNTSWAKTAFSATNMASWVTPGATAVLLITFSATNGKLVRVGDITLNYQ